MEQLEHLTGAAGESWTSDRRPDVRQAELQAAADENLAEPTFKLATYFFAKGDMDSANAYWDKAQALSPDSWNFPRQDWSFLPRTETTKNFMGKENALTNPYYAPMGNLP